MEEKKKKKKIHFDVTLYYPEHMEDDEILDLFAEQIIDEASKISSDSIEIVDEE